MSSCTGEPSVVEYKYTENIQKSQNKPFSGLIRPKFALPVIFAKIKIAKFHEVCTLFDLMPMSHGDERQEISCDDGADRFAAWSAQASDKARSIRFGADSATSEKNIFYSLAFFLMQ
jgi:hypothetical protein